MRTIAIGGTVLAILLWVGLPAHAGPQAAPADWEAQALRGIEAREYEFRATDDGRWSAPNRAHDLRLFVDSTGFELRSRTDSERFRIGLRLRGWGRGAELSDLSSAVLIGREDRVELRRAEGITEWWINDTRGIEHGFDVATPPPGPADEVVLELAIEGAVVAGQGTTAIELRDPAGKPAVHYGGLVVRDAVGRQLPARFAAVPGALRIVFDDRGATYPVTVDPLATSATWEFLGAQDSARLGNSVSTAGDVNGDGYSDVLVAAYVFDEGALDGGKIWVFHGGPNGLSDPSWSAVGDQDGANLGCWVAGLGDVNGDGFDDIAAGAWQYDVDGIPGRGRVYVWHGGPSGLSNAPDRIYNGVQTDENFGVRVAGADVNGDGYRDLLAMSYQYDTRLFINFWVYDAGRVQVFLGGPSGLGTSPWWEYRAESEQGRMSTVAGLGDVNGDGYEDFATGAAFDDLGGTDTGTVYVFHGGPSSPALVRTFNGSQLGGALGFSLAGGDLDGDGYSELIVGAALWDSDAGVPDDGRLFAYRGGAAGVASTPFWQYGAFSPYSQLGWVLSTADTNADGRADILAGSDVWDAPGGIVDAGRAWLFESTPSGPPAAPTWTYSSQQYFAYSGSAISAAGDINGDGFGDIVVGDYGYDGGLYFDEGRVLTFHGSPSGLSVTPAMQITPNQGFAEFGYSVASAGDVNADGHSDVLVGAWLFDDGNPDEGAAFLYLGSAQGLSASPAWTGGSNQDGGHFGYSVASAGDVNGDGYDDVVVGAKDVDSGQTNEGVVYVYHGSSGGLSGTANAVIESNQAGAQLGWSVASAGDVNGDGYAEIAINAILWDSAGATDTGRVWVCYGTSGGVQQPCAWAVEGSQNFENFGHSVASAGDVNRDGYSDLIVGAPQFDQTYTNEGRALIYLGGPAGLSGAAAWSRTGNNAGFLGGVQYGYSVGSAGDVNGDGFADWLVGANAADNGQTDEGRVALYYGTTSIAGVNPGWYGESDQAFAYYGTSVASAGDVNADGFGDVVIGANAWDEGGGSNDGKAWLYLGSPGGLSGGPAWSRPGLHSGASFGSSVSSAGDVDGDGFSDLVVGSRYENGGGVNTARGSAYLFYGNGERGLSRAPGQRYVGNEFRPVAMLGVSDDAAFRVKLMARSPMGRGRVSAQAEAKTIAAPFNGLGLANSAGVLTSAPGGAGSTVELRFPVVGLDGETAYKWRYRVRTQNPAVPWTPWFSLPGNTSTLTDVRTACALATWYRDADGDSYGNPGNTVVSCLQLAGYVANGLDCNDASAAAYPGAEEVCDGLDNDCDEDVDEDIGPTIVAGLLGTKVSGGTVQWSWSAVSGATFDVVWGYLDGVSSSLRATGGNFTLATVNCVANDLATAAVQESILPWSGGAFWYLVRANTCGGSTYESGSPRQVDARDDEIALNGSTCP